MSADIAIAMSKDLLWTVFLITAPILGFSTILGLMVSILQAVTQVQDGSIAFVVKIIAVAVTLLALGPWMLGVVTHYAAGMIANIAMFS
ncbi:MAG: flagellar biosynthetic protein FliQ [Gammaproteobacteria bacterium]|nr:flagellar biosynthetic protein FliQ [Gammaproteobacteria bacterium]